MPLEEAMDILEATYRPPIKRGDLEDVPSGTVVGIIDGEFEQSLAVSPREVVRATRRGVEVFGSSSMGALRAAEVPAVKGVGRVFELYRSGAILRDDEVALLFDPDTKLALTEPLVNIRHAVESLMRSGSISGELGERLLTAATSLNYRDRSYQRIFQEAGLSHREDSSVLLNALKRIDLKRGDARALLLAIRDFLPTFDAGSVRSEGLEQTGDEYQDYLEEVQLDESYPPDAPLLIWETGDSTPLADLLLFLQMTGAYEGYARSAIARFVLQGNALDVECPLDEEAASGLLDRIARRWGWLYSTEVRVTLGDLGIGSDQLVERLEEEVVAREKVLALTRSKAPEFLLALRAGLLLEDLDLKRALLRCGSLEWLAGQASDDDVSPEILQEAKLKLCIASNCFTWTNLLEKVGAYGLTAPMANAFAMKVARARSVGWKRAHRVRPPGAILPSARLRQLCAEGALPLGSRIKRDRRFLLSAGEALGHVERLKKLVGITRVSLLGELSTLGVQVSQASRPDGSMSSTYGSGKSRTDEGAIVGGVMEETEKWALEQARAGYTEGLLASFADLRRAGRRAIDPAALDLPYDSIYRPGLEIAWIECTDLVSGGDILVPAASILPGGLRNNIMHSARAAGPTNYTNGLASGFALEEALVHAICEVIERHSTRLAELRLSNPGGLRPISYPRIDLSSLSEETRALVDRISASAEVGILNITDQIPIPTMQAVIVCDAADGKKLFSAGWASHPDPDMACNMAILEAAQTYIASLAGGREDLSFKARSLGRHERPRPLAAHNEWLALDPDRPCATVDESTGFRSRDALEELLWVVDCVAAAGFEHIAFLDVTQPGMDPARAVFVKIPGLEAPNPFYTGLHARLEALWDLAPAIPPPDCPR
jgi:ribosomal protein S12 methylthiotransferase accessory factor